MDGIHDVAVDVCHGERPATGEPGTIFPLGALIGALYPFECG